MARINIEDSLFRDPRFYDLTIKLGSPEAALGCLFMAWMTAQEFWKTQQNGIPKEVWKNRRLKDAIIEFGLAEDRGDFIYMKGSKEQFSWLSQRVEAGRKGGKARQGAKNTKPRNHREISQAPAKRPNAEAKPLTLTLTPSPSLSLSQSLSQKKEEEKDTSRSAMANGDRPPEESLLDVPELNTSFAVGAFCQAYKRRYSVNYRMTGKDLGSIKRMLKDLGPTVFARLCDAFVDMADPWFITRRHDVTTMEQNLAKVSQFEQSGKLITQTQIRDIDRRATYQELMAAAERGEI